MFSILKSSILNLVGGESLTCTFFGHREFAGDIKEMLTTTLSDLIILSGVDNFFVGNNGKFDRVVTETLRGLKKNYPHIRISTVSAYMPAGNSAEIFEDNVELIYPEGLELVPKRLAIVKRNEWMIEHSDVVVTYVTYVGGASKFEALAKKRKKKVLNIADMQKPL